MRQFNAKGGVASLVGPILFATIVGCFSGCASKAGNVEEIPARKNDRGSSGSSGSDEAILDGGGYVQGSDPRAAEMNSRADRALETLMLRFWSQLHDTNNAHYWTYAQHWDVVLDGVERLGPAAYRGTARMFFDLQNSRGWIRDDYSDENWMVLTLIHAYDLTSDAAYLTKARDLFTDIMGGWDETCCGANKGGIWSRKAKDGKNTAINAGAVISASRLFERTKDGSYLSFAKQVFDFWSKTMVDQTNGHVFDNVTGAGVIADTVTYTHDEGLMIGAVVALAKAEGNPSRLELAHKIALYMMTKESASTPIGTILSDGKCGSKVGEDREQFKGVAARYLADLYLADPSHTEYKEFLVRSVEALWTLARDPASGLVSCDWAGPYAVDTTSAQSNTSAAAALASVARVLGPTTPRPALEYEAEESNLHNVGLEATHAGFHGWGYVAGWGNDGQALDFMIDVPAAGTYDVELRFATSGTATRRLAVNGKTVTPNLAFTATGGYESYLTMKTPVTLTAGPNTVTLAYDAAAGSGGFINLDRALFIAK